MLSFLFDCLAVVLLLFAVFGGIVGELRGHGVLGALLGLCFGPLGILIAALLPERKTEPKPPPDAETIRTGRLVERYRHYSPSKKATDEFTENWLDKAGRLR